MRKAHNRSVQRAYNFATKTFLEMIFGNWDIGSRSLPSTDVDYVLYNVQSFFLTKYKSSKWYKFALYLCALPLPMILVFLIVFIAAICWQARGLTRIDED